MEDEVKPVEDHLVEDSKKSFKESIKDKIKNQSTIINEPKPSEAFKHPEKCRCVDCTGVDGGGRGRHVKGCRCQACRESENQIGIIDVSIGKALKPLIKLSCNIFDSRFKNVEGYICISEDEKTTLSECIDAISQKYDLSSKMAPEITLIVSILVIFGFRIALLYSVYASNKKKESTKKDKEESLTAKKENQNKPDKHAKPEDIKTKKEQKNFTKYL